MPGSTNILKEFLIALGYDIDEQGFRNFQSKLNVITTKVEQLGKIAAVAGTALSVMLLKTASDMEKLYFASQRTGASVTNLMSIRFAAEQIGINADEAAGAVENLAAALRTNPGNQMLLRSLGVKQTADNVQNLLNLVNKLRSMPYFLGVQYAQRFGIDERTLLMLEKNLPQLVEAQRQFRELGKEAGINIDQSADKFHSFMVDVRKLLASVELLALAFGIKILPAAISIVHWLQRGVDFMLQMNKATSGWSTAIGGIAAILGSAIGAFKVLRGLGGLFGIGGAAAGAVGGGEAVAGGGAFLGGPVVWAIVGIIATVVLAWLALHNDKVKKFVGRAYEGTKGYLGQAYDAAKGAVEGWIAKFEGKRLQAYPDAGGYSIGFGHRIRPGENFAGGIDNATALRLLSEDTKAATEAVLKLVKVPLNQNQLAALTDFVYNVGASKFANSTLLKKLNIGDYAGAAEQFERWNKMLGTGGYSRSEDLTNRRLGEKSMFLKPVASFQQETHITVEGATNPRETGKAVRDEQKNVNAALLRDMAGVFA
jgi:GH24 family phage-related lysozyme (muramidase)